MFTRRAKVTLNCTEVIWIFEVSEYVYSWFAVTVTVAGLAVRQTPDVTTVRRTVS